MNDLCGFLFIVEVCTRKKRKEQRQRVLFDQQQQKKERCDTTQVDEDDDDDDDDDDEWPSSILRGFTGATSGLVSFFTRISTRENNGKADYKLDQLWTLSSLKDAASSYNLS